MADIQEEKTKKRIEWIDICKFLGIFAIYLGHFGDAAGNAFHFVFSYHVPLFFFLSGCMNVYDKEKDILKYIKKKIKTLIIPLWGFALLSIIIRVISTNMELSTLKTTIILVIKGCIRNTFFAGSLWFLSCLFIIEVTFKILKKIKFKTIILIISLICFWIAETQIKPRPIVTPHAFYNIDSALYYYIFFAIGYVIYPYIKKMFEFKSVSHKIIFIVLLIISSIFSAFKFEARDYLRIYLGNIKILNTFIPIMTALVIIWLNLSISRLLVGIKVFRKIGKETLYLCGNEYIIKICMKYILGIFGLSISLSNPISVFIYTFFLLIITTKYLIPCEKYLVKIVKENVKNVGSIKIKNK